MFGNAAHPSAPATYRGALGGAVVVAALLLAGCAGGGAGSQSPTAVPSVPASPTAPPSAAPTLTPVPGASADLGAAGCLSRNIDYGPDARGKVGDLVSLATTDITGLRAGDVVERDVPTDVGSGVRIVRAGEVIGTVVYFSDQQGGWLPFSGYLCGGLGFRP